jgi:hypothetical protein
VETQGKSDHIRFCSCTVVRISFWNSEVLKKQVLQERAKPLPPLNIPCLAIAMPQLSNNETLCALKQDKGVHKNSTDLPMHACAPPGDTPLSCLEAQSVWWYGAGSRECRYLDLDVLEEFTRITCLATNQGCFLLVN